MRQILFICTGNYYRSRFAEIYFNHLSAARGLSLRSRSRGFRMNPEKNKGALSPHTVSYLKELDIPTHDVGIPTKLHIDDLHSATRIIAMDEKEHYAMMTNLFPDWVAKVEFWNFEDDYLVSPLHVLPALQIKVDALMEGFIVGETVKLQ